MRITESQLRNIVREELKRAERLNEEAVAGELSVDTLKAVEQKFKEILQVLPRDFGPIALVVSAAKAIVNARKAAESKPSGQ